MAARPLKFPSAYTMAHNPHSVRSGAVSGTPDQAVKGTAKPIPADAIAPAKSFEVVEVAV
ncbi:hypothetical protein [Sphingomonas montana]|uniref:hypothetical protein n=1 Tax=Sphingomonas montana TaxID=1843236 RepID=UPI0013EBFA78|nr:hypothetical protein [Sphingomonas montana]